VKLGLEDFFGVAKFERSLLKENFKTVTTNKRNHQVHSLKGNQSLKVRLETNSNCSHSIDEL